ncbi:hypothetical protein GCM10010121_096450 [Streptomyces brasiliensis]|uniref:HTH arsR-type domain-containing protein n=1 Tax=Streptomyces brasiliensis TaxID=1954 RepID=A0A917UNB4_9ACTN|nr:hypothetical protein GCM10010121_096450 [Streptomyces brasiliensis]
MDSLDLLAHPIRLRIVHAMGGGRLLTTAQLCARIPEASSCPGKRAWTSWTAPCPRRPTPDDCTQFPPSPGGIHGDGAVGE